MPTAKPGTTKKKGTATIAKRPSKRPKGGSIQKLAKKQRAETARGSVGLELEDDEDDDEDDEDGEEESDNGPYCICRGPDDHRWMICCEACEDWFHGECINMNEEIGENLIEKFICPNCAKGNRVTIYKKTCALGACRKAARLSEDPSSVFCSNEHAHSWWERMVSRLPKAKNLKGLSDHLSQDELVALLNSGMAGPSENGKWHLAKAPFAGGTTQDDTDEPLPEILSEEERKFLENAAKTRMQMTEETVLCRRMLSMVDLVVQRRRTAIATGRIANDCCGYDPRLDSVSSRDAFAAFGQSPEGEAIFSSIDSDNMSEAMSKLNEPITGSRRGDELQAMCERKRCKIHREWQKILPLGVKHRIKEMTERTSEVVEEERIVREAAGERWKRRKAENNWVEVVEG